MIKEERVSDDPVLLAYFSDSKTWKSLKYQRVDVKMVDKFKDWMTTSFQMTRWGGFF